MYAKNVSKLLWTLPAISEPAVYEFQFKNVLKSPTSWALKFDECITCKTEKINNKENVKKSNSTYSNKCTHHSCIRISPTVKSKVIEKK